MPLTPGTAEATASGNASAVVEASDATGGTEPYVYQWQRSLTAGSGFANVSTGYGFDSLILVDAGLTNGVTYHYRLRYTDAAAAVVYSNEVDVVPASTAPITTAGGGKSGIRYEIWAKENDIARSFETTSSTTGIKCVVPFQYGDQFIQEMLGWSYTGGSPGTGSGSLHRVLPERSYYGRRYGPTQYALTASLLQNHGGWTQADGATGGWPQFGESVYQVNFGAPLYKVLPDGTPLTATIANKALTSNVATLTTGSAHGFTAGNLVAVSGIDATFNGTYTIVATPSSTAFTFARTAANVASSASGGTATSGPVGSVLFEHERYVVWKRRGVAENEKIPGGGFKIAPGEPGAGKQISEVGVKTGRTVQLEAKWIDVPFVNYSKIGPLSNKVNAAPVTFNGVTYDAETVLFATWGEDPRVNPFGTATTDITFTFSIRCDGRSWNKFWLKAGASVAYVSVVDDAGNKPYAAGDLNDLFSMA
jgi:hypothetical protein